MPTKTELDAIRSEARPIAALNTRKESLRDPAIRAPFCGLLLEERRTSCKHFQITISMHTAASS
jgi:hypothetical protein